MILRSCLVVLILAAAVLPIGAAGADERHRCLDTEQRRAAIAGRQAVPLAKAIRAARAHVGGDIVQARLCEQGKGLIYVLTLLGRDGRVMRASVDGASGSFLRAR